MANAAFKGGTEISSPGSAGFTEKASCSTCHFGREKLCCLQVEGEACPTFRWCDGPCAGSMGPSHANGQDWRGGGSRVRQAIPTGRWSTAG